MSATSGSGQAAGSNQGVELEGPDAAPDRTLDKRSDAYEHDVHRHVPERETDHRGA